VTPAPGRRYVTKVEYPAAWRSAKLAPMDRFRPLIAVVDDEPQFGKALSRLLKTHAIDVVSYTSGHAFLVDFTSRSPDCLLLDLHMPALSGFEVLERIAGRRIPSFVITGHDQPGNAERVQALGAVNYFLKPVNESELLAAIRAVVEPPASATVAPANSPPKR
jgi:FixJ family two-component response regulator